MKSPFAIVFGTMSVLILLGILVVAYLFIHHPSTIGLSQDTKPHHEMVVIDFDGNGLTSQKELLAGIDAIIAVNSLDERNKAGLFNSTSGLLGLKLKNRWITPKDPAYDMLMLVFVTPDGKHHYKTLAEAGIQAIRIDTKRLQGGIFTNDPSQVLPGNNMVGEAILKNGSHSPIRLIATQ